MNSILDLTRFLSCWGPPVVYQPLPYYHTVVGLYINWAVVTHLLSSASLMCVQSWIFSFVFLSWTEIVHFPCSVYPFIQTYLIMELSFDICIQKTFKIWEYTSLAVTMLWQQFAFWNSKHHVYRNFSNSWVRLWHIKTHDVLFLNKCQNKAKNKRLISRPPCCHSVSYVFQWKQFVKEIGNKSNSLSVDIVGTGSYFTFFVMICKPVRENLHDHNK